MPFVILGFNTYWTNFNHDLFIIQYLTQKYFCANRFIIRKIEVTQSLQFLHVLIHLGVSSHSKNYE